MSTALEPKACGFEPAHFRRIPESAQLFSLVGCLILTLALAAPLLVAAVGVGSESPVDKAFAPREPQATGADNVVNLFVTARDENGRPVSDLTPAEIHLLEDGREQKIESFGLDSSTAVLLGVLIDISGSRHDEKARSAEFTALSALLHTVLQGVDAAYIVAFSDSMYLVTNLTKDLKELDRGLDQIAHGRAYGSTALYDAVYVAADAKLSGPSGRRALLVLSDFFDNASTRLPEAAIQEAQKTQTSVYCLVDEMTPGEESKRATKKARQQAEQLSVETGGEASVFDSPESLAGAFERVASDLRNFYVLRYHPTNTAHDGKIRKLKPETSRKGVSLLASRAYYVPKQHKH